MPVRARPQQRVCQRPLWSPKVRPPPHEAFRSEAFAVAVEEEADLEDAETRDWPAWLLMRDRANPRLGAAEQMRRIAAEAAAGAQLDLSRTDPASLARTRAFAECCVMSVALWRRFGTAEFAGSLGWVHRTDYAAAMALMPGRAVEAAVTVWRSGRHAAGEDSTPQQLVRKAELRAWELGRRKAEPGVLDHELDVGQAALLAGCSASMAARRLVTERMRSATAAGEAVVRGVYERLIVAHQHNLWDLWRKREAVVKAALEDGGPEPIRDVLRQVRGYCGPDRDAERAAWALAVDIKTLTPLAEDGGPVAWSGEYAAWLRERYCKRSLPPATVVSSGRLLPGMPGTTGTGKAGLPGLPSPRARPQTGSELSIIPDMTGLPLTYFEVT